MAQVFISYSRRDEEFVLKFAHDLRQRGVDIWLDKFDIPQGEEPWDDQIEAALNTCPYFLVVLSPQSVVSQNVKDEINFALEENNTIIPVLYQSCNIPFRVRRFQYVDFRSDYASALIEILARLRLPEPGRYPILTIDFVVKPPKVRVGDKANWMVILRNEGNDDLYHVNVRHGRALLVDESFTLSAGAERTFSFSTTYRSYGKKTEQVIVSGFAGDGKRLREEIKTAVQVGPKSEPVFSRLNRFIGRLVDKTGSFSEETIQSTMHWVKHHSLSIGIVLIVLLMIIIGAYFKDPIIETLQEGQARIGSFLRGYSWEGNIAYSSYRDGNWEIYSTKSDGESYRLTNSKFLDRHPAWSPDGSQLAFVSNRDGNWEIYKLDSDGVAARMTNNSSMDRDPTWSPDGSVLTFVSYRDGNGEIYTLNPDGELTRLTIYSAEDREPDWSPDGSKLAFASDRHGNWEIYTLNSEGKINRLTHNSAKDREPDWSPDGSKLAFASDRAGNWEIYVLDSEGEVTRLTNNPAEDREPVWSPDGLSLAFSSDRAGSGRDIYMLDSNGNASQVTKSGTDENPDWAP